MTVNKKIMTKTRRVFLTARLSLLALVGLAQPSGFSVLKDTASLKKILIKEASSTQTIQSDFVQEKNISALSEKIITKGKFYFKKESLLR